jgi:hypothetical protein
VFNKLAAPPKNKEGKFSGFALLQRCHLYEVCSRGSVASKAVIVGATGVTDTALDDLSENA